MATTEQILFLIGNLLFASVLITPALVATVARRGGSKWAVTLAASLGLTAGVLVALAPGSSWADTLSAAIATGFGVGGLGVVLWHYGSKPIALGRLFVGLAAFFFVATIDQHLFLQALAGNSPIDLGHSWLMQLHHSFDQYIQMLSAQVDSKHLGNLNALKAEKSALVWTLFRIMPSMFSFGVAGLVLINLLLVRRTLPALMGLSINRWRVPDAAIWLVLVPGLGLLPYLILPMVGGDKSGVASLFYVSLNVVLIALIPYTMQGLGVLSFFMRRWRFPRLLRGLTYFMIMSQGLVAMVPALGLVEFWTDWRGRLTARDAAERDKHENENRKA